MCNHRKLQDVGQSRDQAKTASASRNGASSAGHLHAISCTPKGLCDYEGCKQQPLCCTEVKRNRRCGWASKANLPAGRASLWHGAIAESAAQLLLVAMHRVLLKELQTLKELRTLKLGKRGPEHRPGQASKGIAKWSFLCRTTACHILHLVRGFVRIEDAGCRQQSRCRIQVKRNNCLADGPARLISGAAKASLLHRANLERIGKTHVDGEALPGVSKRKLQPSNAFRHGPEHLPYHKSESIATLERLLTDNARRRHGN